MPGRTLFIAGNWKMNKTADEAEKTLVELKSKVASIGSKIKIAVCPTFTALDRASKVIKGTNIKLGAQDVSIYKSGAYTGEISVEMLKALNVEYVIVGHSERRQYHNETDKIVADKAKAVLNGGLFPIVCIGETLEEREAGKMPSVITTQLKGSLNNISETEILKVTIAYEPVWAIGTGKTASPAQAQEVHALIRKLLTGKYGEKIAEQIIIQYGGSVKPDNAAELMGQKDIDGALVGGASLEAEAFSVLISKAL